MGVVESSMERLLLARELGPRIQTAREVAGLDRASLAARVGCTGRYLALLERAERVPSLELLGALATALGSSVDALLGSYAPCLTWAEIDALVRALPPRAVMLLLELLDLAGSP